ncbi:squalene--hopene cyclase [Paenibacillus tarimensis]
MYTTTDQAVQQTAQRLLGKQSQDGSWRFCFEMGVMTDAYMIIILRTLQIRDESLIRMLHDRMAARQEPNGAWKVYPDETAGNLSATVEAYAALLYSGHSRPSDANMKKAKQFIVSHGGLRGIDSLLTKVILACIGQYRWPPFFPLPVELMLVPSAAPVNFYDFSGYARIHLAPVMLLAGTEFAIRDERTPDLSGLIVRQTDPAHDQTRSERSNKLWTEMIQFVKKLTFLPAHLRGAARRKAEQYMLDRIEPDGTLYSYATATFLMIFALLSLGYGKRHPVILRAVEGLKSIVCRSNGTIHVQNSTSTVWDTALVSHALQQAGVTPEHPAIQSAGLYLLSKQHTRLGDWSRHVTQPVPGGWGFSDINTINPDVDDTTAALRAIHRLGSNSPDYRNAADKGLHWVVSMQNDDGGWPAFERNTDNPLLGMLPLDDAPAAAIDPSTADLTGRTLEYLGRYPGLTVGHPFIRRAVRWLLDRQEADGPWYGRWGICYIYGTWAALTGMLAVGENPEHPALRRGASWLLRIQNPDGGWGESCASDQLKRYVPLHKSTLSQTAWALDALTAYYPEPNSGMEKGVQYLLNALDKADDDIYPTGGGLPRHFYIRYHSYPYIWPLLALSHYKKKYGKAAEYD